MTDIPQFGIEPDEDYSVRTCAYAIVFDGDRHRLLALKVGAEVHLPGGGLEGGEDAAIAVRRETREEAGCDLTNLEYLGRANQFVCTKRGRLVNKHGVFYKAGLAGFEDDAATEPDHEPCWLTTQEFLDSTAKEFHKWAVREALK